MKKLLKVSDFTNNQCLTECRNVNYLTFNTVLDYFYLLCPFYFENLKKKKIIADHVTERLDVNFLRRLVSRFLV